jgi:hypothetical protein
MKAPSPPPKRRGAPKGTMPPNAGKGRPKGSKNLVSHDVRALAQKYGPDCILGLAIMAGLAPVIKRLPQIKPASNETVRERCMDSLMDRAYGKATQPLEHSVNESVEGLLDRLGR